MFCYYNSENSDGFVSQEIFVHKYQLFAPNSQGNKAYLAIGDIIHVESIDLINSKYAIKWKVLS